MNERREKCWKSIAERTKLDFQPDTFGYPELSGTLDGITIQAKPTVIKSGKFNTYYAESSAQIGAELPDEMQIYHEGLFEKIKKGLGDEDIQVGDKALDKLFIFKGGRPDKIKQLVKTPAVKTALIALHKYCKSIHIESAAIHLKEEEISANEKKILRNLRLSVDLARAFQEATDAAQPPAHPTSHPAAHPTTTPSQPQPQPDASPGHPRANSPDDWWG